MIAGHAFGEPVLLARVSDSFFALGAHCTHYSAPLAEGIIVGETLRCPWHHACFELRNGAASSGPALNDLPVYDVVVESDMVRVSGKRENGSAAAIANRPRTSRAPDKVNVDQKPSAGPASVLIAGGGPAGEACAEMLRREGYRGPITIVDPDKDAPYDRPNISKDFMAGNAPADWLPLHPPEFFAAQGIEILSGVEIREIDHEKQAAQLSDGTTRKYGVLLIATGATPNRLDLPGAERINYLRSLSDCRKILKKAAATKDAVVIGASFIGLEVAASLRTRGLNVTVVGPENIPLERILGADLGKLIQQVHEEHGVKFMLGHKPKSIEADSVTLDDGAVINAGLVVAGVGVKPNLVLAKQAGVLLNEGVMVDEFLETSVARIFAAGDVARWPDSFTGEPIRVEHWVVAERMGQVVARNMLGHRDRFDDVPFFWSAHYDSLSIHYSGHATAWDETRITGELKDKDCAVEYYFRGRRIAVATINRDRQNLEVELEMEKELLMAPPPTPSQVPKTT